jgi:uncharacterized membrane protein YcaP (DUF421 family)
MDFGWIWKSILIVILGTMLFRLAGRKSISQMTVAQTVIMIAVGAILVQPVGNRSIWITLGIAALLIGTLIFLEYVQIKSNFLESFFSGQAIPVIENGMINEENLKRIRLPVDKLEMRLRQSNIKRVSDVQWATLESNGQLGYTLYPQAQPATKQDIQSLVDLINAKLPYPQYNLQVNQIDQTENIFTEVSKNGHKNPPPEHLQ